MAQTLRRRSQHIHELLHRHYREVVPTNTQILWIVIAVIVVVLIGAAAWYFTRQKRSQKLRERFGPEYHHTLRTLKSRDVAESELREREKHVSQYRIVPLSAAERTRYLESWMAIQSQFVDQPETAVAKANQLVREVMDLRGYPTVGFEQAAADLSVNHPAVVEHYRAAHRISERSKQGVADTEELRHALVYYRALFEELLGKRGAIRDQTVLEGRREHNGKFIPVD